MVVAPHNPMSPLATAVNVHFAASTPNFLILEYRAPDAGAYKDVLKEPLMVKDGYLDIPQQAGLGSRTQRRSLSEHAAAALEERHRLSRRRLSGVYLDSEPRA